MDKVEQGHEQEAMEELLVTLSDEGLSKVKHMQSKLFILLNFIINKIQMRKINETNGVFKVSIDMKKAIFVDFETPANLNNLEKKCTFRL